MRETAAETLNAMEPLDAKHWTELVESSELPDVYYLPEYACATAEIEQTEPVALIAGPSSCRMLAPLLVRRMSTTTNGSSMEWFDAATPYGYGGLLRLSPSDLSQTAALPCFLEQLHDWCSSRRIVCCVIRLHPLIEQQEWFAPNGHWQESLRVHSRGSTSSIQLQDWDEKLNQPQHMRRDRRADMRLAARELRTTWMSGEDYDIETGLGIFSSLYGELLERHAAEDFYRFPSAYFWQLTRLGSRLGIAFAWHGDDPVGANLFLAGDRFAHGHLAGTNQQGREYGAATMLIVEGARWARQRGCKLLHLGGGISPGDRLEDYKRSFGSQLHHYGYVTLVVNRREFEQISALPNAPWPYNFHSLGTDPNDGVVR